MAIVKEYSFSSWEKESANITGENFVLAFSWERKKLNIKDSQELDSDYEARVVLSLPGFHVRLDVVKDGTEPMYSFGEPDRKTKIPTETPVASSELGGVLTKTQKDELRKAAEEIRAQAKNNQVVSTVWEYVQRIAQDARIED